MTPWQTELGARAVVAVARAYKLLTKQQIMRTNKQLLAVIAAVSLAAACVATCLKYDTEYKFLFGVISWLLWLFAVLPSFLILLFYKEQDL